MFRDGMPGGDVPARIAASSAQDGCAAALGMTSKGGTETTCIAARCEASHGWREGQGETPGACAPCPAGTYGDSAQGNTCQPMDCPEGYAAYGEAAESATDGCAPVVQEGIRRVARPRAAPRPPASPAPAARLRPRSPRPRAVRSARSGPTQRWSGALLTCDLSARPWRGGRRASSADGACAICPIGSFSTGEGPRSESACPRNHIATLEGGRARQRAAPLAMRRAL